jgi:hypothetical protein
MSLKVLDTKTLKYQSYSNSDFDSDIRHEMEGS